MTTELAKRALDLHNIYRAQHGSPPLEWSEELAKAGTEHAEALIANPGQPLVPKPGTFWGQNIFEYEAEGYGQVKDEDVVEDAIHSWYEDVGNYNATTPSASKGGNFSQMIWKSTLRVGLGVARKEDGGSTTVVILAFYDPPGNFKDQFSANVSSQNASSLRFKCVSSSSTQTTSNTSSSQQTSTTQTQQQQCTNSSTSQQQQQQNTAVTSGSSDQSTTTTSNNSTTQSTQLPTNQQISQDTKKTTTTTTTTIIEGSDENQNSDSLLQNVTTSSDSSTTQQQQSESTNQNRASTPSTGQTLDSTNQNNTCTKKTTTITATIKGSSQPQGQDIEALIQDLVNTTAQKIKAINTNVTTTTNQNVTPASNQEVGHDLTSANNNKTTTITTATIKNPETESNTNTSGSKVTTTTTTRTTTIKGTTMEGAENPDFTKNVTVTKTVQSSDGTNSSDTVSTQTNVPASSVNPDEGQRSTSPQVTIVPLEETHETRDNSNQTQDHQTSSCCTNTKKTTTVTTSSGEFKESTTPATPDLTAIIQNIAETAEKKGLKVTIETQDVPPPDGRNMTLNQVTTITAKGSTVDTQDLGTLMEDLLLVSKIPNLASTKKTTTVTTNTTVSEGIIDGQDLSTLISTQIPATTSTDDAASSRTVKTTKTTTTTTKSSNIEGQGQPELGTEISEIIDKGIQGSDTQTTTERRDSQQGSVKTTKTVTTTIQKGSGGTGIDENDQDLTSGQKTITTKKTVTTTTTKTSGGVDSVEIQPEMESHTSSVKTTACVQDDSQQRATKVVESGDNTITTSKKTTTTKTTIRKLTSETLNVAVKVHNELREKHGAQAVSIDEKLCEEAQLCARSIVTKTVLEKTSDKLSVGQNVYRMSGPAVDPSEAVRTAVNTWYSKMVDYNWDDPLSSGQSSKLFSQLVWKSVKQIGVGIETEGTMTAIVVYYSPPGNVMTDERFRENVQKPTS